MDIQVFISYSSSDVEVAERVAAACRAEGWEPWFAPDRLDVSTNFAETISTIIRQRPIVVVRWSRGAAESADVAREVGLGGKYDVTFFPMRLDDTPYSEAVEYYRGLLCSLGDRRRAAPLKFVQKSAVFVLPSHNLDFVLDPDWTQISRDRESRRP